MTKPTQEQVQRVAEAICAKSRLMPTIRNSSNGFEEYKVAAQAVLTAYDSELAKENEQQALTNENSTKGENK